MSLRELFARVPSVRGDEARSLVNDGATLLDVREAEEWNAGHAPQATHLPLSRLADAARKLRSGRRIVVVCRSGNRSHTATARLRAMGYDAVNLAGGMRAWAGSGGQVVDRRGRPGAVV